MRAFVRICIVLAGAAGFCFALAHVASADVVNPTSAYQPASTSLVPQGTSQNEAPKPVSSKPAEKSIPSSVAQPDETVVATPATEQQVKQAPARPVLREPVRLGGPSPVHRVIGPFQVGLHRIGEYLERAVSACRVGLGMGNGGPFFVLAVLGLAAALNRRRVLWARSAADEDTPELLYAGEVIAPG
jgi:hypothetical protein